MCILTFVTRYCERFPFVLIGNRDEQLGRGTRHLRLDAHTGLLWAVDQVAGGSWMGMEPHSGRFTILTNCRRAAAAPLTRHNAAASTTTPTSAAGARPGEEEEEEEAGEGEAAVVDWRGAAPLSHIKRHTKAVAVRPQLRDAAQPDAMTLAYEPPSSRGTIVKNFLLTGQLPDRTGSDSFPSPPLSPLTSPFYAGYNLLTCDTLRTTIAATTDDDPRRAPTVLYTTNRYGAQHGLPVAPGEVHVLQNSALDNVAGEPISARLRHLFETALHDVVAPLAEDASAPFSVTDVATRLADACLCDRSNFDIPQMMKEGGDLAAALRATVHSTNPLLGFSEAELPSFFGPPDASTATGAPQVFTDGGAALVEAYLQANILKKPVGGHGTRVQSVVLVERVPQTGGADGAPPSHRDVIHFCQRDVSFEGEEQACVGAPWIAFRIDADGTVVREDEGTLS